MSASDPVAPGKKYLQNATLNFLPEASWAVPRPIAHRSAAAAVEPLSQTSLLLSPSAAPLMMSPTCASPGAMVLLQPAVGFLSPRQPPHFTLHLYVEISPRRKLISEANQNVRQRMYVETLTRDAWIIIALPSSPARFPSPQPGSQQGVR